MYGRELEVVIGAAREAADLLLGEAARPGGPRGRDALAPIDAEMGSVLCARIEAAFPEDAIVCEEGGGRTGQTERVFIIDPHDGTHDFLLGRRETSISIALLESGQLVLGVVVAPFPTAMTGPGGLVVTWALGYPLCSNGKAVSRGKEESELTPAALALVSANLPDELLRLNQRFLAPARVAPCSSFATRLALVACGRASIAVTLNNPLAPWDFAGGQALLQGAGGDLVGHSGEPVRWDGTELSAEHRNLTAYFGARSLACARSAATSLRGLIRPKPGVRERF